MNIDQAYTIIKFLANKNSAGYLSPESFNTLFNVSQSQLFNHYLDQIKGWSSVGRDNKRYPGDVQPVTSVLSPFKVGPAVWTVSGVGQLVKPTELVYLDAIYKITGPNSAKRVIRVEEDRIWSFIDSTLDPVSENPIYTEYADIYQVYPFNLGTVQASYYVNPTACVWGYTLDVNNRPVYDPTTSVQPLWSDDMMNKIIMRMCFNLGIRLKDQDLVVFEKQINAEGE